MCRHPDLAAALAVLAVLGALASAGVPAYAAVIDGAPAASKAGSSGAAPPPRYHLRCWQNGRLLFEQAVAALPAEAGRGSTRLQAKDGAQEPVIVYETRNATCMARSLRAAR